MTMGQFFVNQLMNQFTAGGIAVVAFTATLALLRNLPARMWGLFVRYAVVAVDIADHDSVFFWFQKWLAENPATQHKKRLTATTRIRPVSNSGAAQFASTVAFTLAPGWHFFSVNSNWFLVHKTRQMSDQAQGELAYRETLVIYARTRKAVEDLLEAARRSDDPVRDTIMIYRTARWGGFQEVQRIKPRPLSSVILDQGFNDKLAADLRWFNESHEWYVERSIPYQRGYLFSGPPGNGKSSLALAIAGELRKDLYLVSLNQEEALFVQGLDTIARNGGIALIEDVDCVFEGRTANDEKQHLSFSALLNALDGASAPNGRVLIMTTNHPEQLDPALLRPGRLDQHYELENATEDQAYRLFLRFHPERPDLARAFARVSAGESMATLQERLLSNRDWPEGSLTRGAA